MRKWMLCVILLLALPALACSFSLNMGGETPEPGDTPAPVPSPTAELPTPEPTPTGPRVYDVFFASDVTSDGAPVDIATEFSVLDGTSIVYAFVSFEGMTDGASCESVWYLDGEEVARSPQDWPHGTSGGPVWFANIHKDGGLPAGEYDWEMYVEGELAATGSFPLRSGPSSLYEDDFDDPGSGWAQSELDGGSVGYGDGVYYITSRVEKTVIWSKAGVSLSDVVIEVEATQISAGPEDDNSYGVMCRVQPNNDGYVLRISGDGYCAIHKRTGEDYTALADWSTSDRIRQGNSTNDIRAICDGPRIQLLANGQVIAQASDSTFSEGDVGLIVATYEDGATEVHFDNLVVLPPAPRP